MAWFQVHQSLFSHRKVTRLADLLSIHEMQAVGHLTALWGWALDNAPDGHLSMSARAIARGSYWDGDNDAFITALVESGLVDEEHDGLHIHDWQQYAGALAERREREAERVRQLRAQQRKAKESSTSENKPGHSDGGMNGEQYAVRTHAEKSTVQQSTSTPTPPRSVTQLETTTFGLFEFKNSGSGSGSGSGARHTPRKPVATQAQIDAIYRAYPRQLKPKEAYRAITRALGEISAGKLRPFWLAADVPWPPPDPVAWLLARVQLYAECRAGKDEQYTPYPASWMNGGCYLEDEAKWRLRGNDRNNSAAGRMGRSERRREVAANVTLVAESVLNSRPQ